MRRPLQSSRSIAISRCSLPMKPYRWLRLHTEESSSSFLHSGVISSAVSTQLSPIPSSAISRRRTPSLVMPSPLSTRIAVLSPSSVMASRICSLPMCACPNSPAVRAASASTRLAFSVKRLVIGAVPFKISVSIQ